MWTRVMRFFVFFFAGDVKAISEPECTSGIWIGILGAIVFCTLLVIFILVLKICRRKEGKKSEKSLWTEQHSLKAKASAED